jgi:hypothetical protein
MADVPVPPLAQDPQVADATIANAVVQAVQQDDPLNPSQAGGARPGVGAKEHVGSSFDAVVSEVPGAQAVELEQSAEISPEVESWVEEVQRHDLQPPQQVVVADDTATQPTNNYVSEPVVVLPATQQVIQAGLKKKVSDSVRWLAEWCLRIVKKFHGSVVYRPTQKDA